MPELPEVETVVRHLRPQLLGRTITGFTAPWPKVTAPAHPDAFAREVVGRTIGGVRRRGKFILLQLDRGHIHLHLRMTGRLVLASPGDEGDQRHVTAVVTLSDSHRLIFRDMRKFGRLGYLADLAPLEAKLGPEPLSPEFTAERFYQLLQGRRRQIKPLLLDQGFIAGLGNIYVDEALFAAGIHPRAEAASQSAAKAEALHRAIRHILQRSIEKNGTTIINFQYGTGSTGRFREDLRVFRREGEPCLVCSTPVVKIRVAQRGTHLCPTCQAI
ncbi:MAG: DNA-formamidopyrimidine glycosylase [Candidatus Marinimicrobia bacterium]|nr:DNA-formamidopyrimidine glycosylase [Candidatus Neomarinimicrobiota bacterium]